MAVARIAGALSRSVCTVGGHIRHNDWPRRVPGVPKCGALEDGPEHVGVESRELRRGHAQRRRPRGFSGARAELRVCVFELQSCKSRQLLNHRANQDGFELTQRQETLLAWSLS